METGTSDHRFVVEMEDEAEAAHGAGHVGPTWEPEILEELLGLLHRIDPGSELLGRRLEQLRLRHGDPVFTELLYLLSHLRFDPLEAKQHWAAIRDHRQRMQRALGTPVDLRVALVSYFVEVNRKLRNPKIIEMKLFERTRASAYRDELTGLHNYRMFREYLAQEVRRSERCGTPLSLIMTDVDHFKAYNDRNGHEAGNSALAAVGRLLVGALRKADVAARYGGEEFALILPSTSKTTAHAVAERIREAVERHCFANEETQPGGSLTISVGVATLPADADAAAELVRRADRAMYLAKTGGRNRVELYAGNRRSFVRVAALLPGELRAVGERRHVFTTVNVSEAGLLLLTAADLPAEGLLDILLQLPGERPALRIAARVVHCEPDAASGNKVAVRLIDVSDTDRAALVDYAREAGDDGEEEI